jgi:predicted DNA-binding transcriptional regulator AlpA
VSAFPEIPKDAPKLVRAPQLAKWFGVTRKTIMAWAAMGILPRPLVLGEKTKLFDTEAVRKALARRIAEATEGPREKRRA